MRTLMVSDRGGSSAPRSITKPASREMITHRAIRQLPDPIHPAAVAGMAD
jgi:hypothetical protein